MSQESIRRKLSNAYGHAAQALGTTYSVYRPISLFNALADENFIKQQKASFTLSRKYEHDQKERYSFYITYTKHADINVGDIFVDKDGITYVIVWNQGIEDVMAMRAFHKVSLLRATYTTTSGLDTETSVIGKNLPASFAGISSKTTVALPHVANTAQTSRYELRIFTPGFQILQTDNIQMEDGQLLHIDTIETSQFYQTLMCSEVP
jgi:hypothetical protein